MSFFSEITRNYRNSQAQVQVFLYVVESLDASGGSAEPVFSFRCTGLEIHNFARHAKRGFLKILNEDPGIYGKKIKLPDDYWRLAVRVVANNIDRKELCDLTRDGLCLVIESAFETFTNRDICSVLLSKDGSVAVEKLQSQSPFDHARILLGSVQREHGDGSDA